MTAQDYQKLYEEGFKPEDLTIEALSEAIQVIKEYFEGAALKDTDAYSTNEHSKNTNIMNELSGNTGVISENEIIRRMEAENLPVNKDSVDRIMRALKISEDIPRLEKKDILYLLNKGLAPSIENLYKARYSSQNGEMSVKLTDGEWEALIPQVCEIIGDTAETSGKELFEDAKWLIENNVPLTKENIKLISDVKDLIKSYSPDLVLDRIFKGMKEGILPKDAVLIEKDELSINETSQGDNIAAVKSINIKQLLEDIHGITEDDIIRTVNTYDDITIRNLTDSREGDETDVQSVENADKEKQVKFLTAKRQIEEIRLKMTLEAAIRLEKKGFHIETETLERVVERLRTEEENYYKELYSQTVSESDEPDEASLKLLQLTSETVYKLKLMPIYVLGTTLNDRKDRTMPDLLEQVKVKDRTDKQIAYSPVYNTQS